MISYQFWDKATLQVDIVVLISKSTVIFIIVVFVLAKSNRTST